MHPRRLEWRRGKFHATLVPTKAFVKLYLHVDVPVEITPLIVRHTMRKQGRDIRRELKKIEETMGLNVSRVVL